MTDRNRLEALLERLEKMRSAAVPLWQRPIQEVACAAIEAEISEVGRRLASAGS